MSSILPIPVPTTDEGLIAWALANPNAIRQAIKCVNLLYNLQTEITLPSTRTGKQSIIFSDDLALLPIPLKFDTPIADSTASAASASAQLNLLLAALRRTKQLPS